MSSDQKQQRIRFAKAKKENVDDDPGGADDAEKKPRIRFANVKKENDNLGSEAKKQDNKPAYANARSQSKIVALNILENVPYATQKRYIASRAAGKATPQIEDSSRDYIEDSSGEYVEDFNEDSSEETSSKSNPIMLKIPRYKKQKR